MLKISYRLMMVGLKKEKNKSSKNTTYSGFEIKSVLEPGFPSFM